MCMYISHRYAQQIRHRTDTSVSCAQVGLRDLHQSGCNAKCWDSLVGDEQKRP